MNPRANAALIASLVDRWSETHNPSANTTCVASHAGVAQSRHILDTLIASQRNQAAAAFTATLTIRDSSIAGTILAQLEFVTAVNAADRFSERVGIPALKGNAIVAAFDPPAASVTQKITIAGYTPERDAY